MRRKKESLTKILTVDFPKARAIPFMLAAPATLLFASYKVKHIFFIWQAEEGWTSRVEYLPENIVTVKIIPSV
jgi:hypothetical protein